LNTPVFFYMAFGFPHADQQEKYFNYSTVPFIFLRGLLVFGIRNFFHQLASR
jgi:hypothetical protein